MEQSPLILIADDDLSSRKTVEGILGDFGCRFLTAEDGIQTLDAIQSSSPDLVLLEINMPKINGLDVLEKIKGEEATRLIPVIIVTASYRRAERIRAIELGSDDFLTKPVNAREFQARVRSLLRFKTHLNEILAYRQQLENQVEDLVNDLRDAMVKVSSRIRSIDESSDLMKAFSKN